jgi:hypothetical protein
MIDKSSDTHLNPKLAQKIFHPNLPFPLLLAIIIFTTQTAKEKKW